MRVCLIASSRFPLREPFMGGLEAQTHALATQLLQRRHRVSVFAAPGSDPGLGAKTLPVAEFVSSEQARQDVGSVPESWMREHHAYLDLMMSLARGQYGRFDVVHNNSLHHLPVAMSSLLDVPVLTTLHTPPIAWLESAAALSGQRSKFVAVSRQVARAWRHVVDARTIHNGVDTSFWCAGGGGEGAIWTGRIVPEKAPHEALEAARLAGIPIEVAGPVHDRSYFEKEVLPRLGDRAHYLGHLEGTALRDAVGRASVAVVTPRWDEPFGLVATEALSCGTPVAAYASGGLCEIVDERSGRLAPVGDMTALAQAMLEATRMDRGEARDRACAQFGMGRMVDAYESLYAEIACLAGAA
ncbi:MAG: glycosyl transferase family 1 [Marmoricola sp.]|nr:glycosyl transferase family 1 [Marmoricola sp.]